MGDSREYPEEPAGPFPIPPATVEDAHGRTIELTAHSKPVDPSSAEPILVDELVDMYVQFDPKDRAQGIPPSGADRVRRWIDPIVETGINVAARYDGAVVGHTTLVPDTDDIETLAAYDDIDWELAIFVLQEYQQAGIGTELLEHLLGYASEIGIDRVWLTVERWNSPAIALYERVGFETTGAGTFEQEMSIRIA